MNAIEIEEAISQLAEQPFQADNFPYAFLEAFGNKATTIKRLQSGSTNSSDIESGVLQRNNIHIATCAEGQVTQTLELLRQSPATHKGKVKFILATDGIDLEAEDIATGETIALRKRRNVHHAKNASLPDLRKSKILQNKIAKHQSMVKTKTFLNGFTQ